MANNRATTGALGLFRAKVYLRAGTRAHGAIKCAALERRGERGANYRRDDCAADGQ